MTLNTPEGNIDLFGEYPPLEGLQRRGLDFCLRCDADDLRVISAGTHWLVECDECGWFDRLTDQKLTA